MLLNDKVVMVSGIGPGLGVKLAVHAAIEGAAAVAISSRTARGLDDAEARIRATGARCKVINCLTDIRDVAACEAFAAATIDTCGRIDALVNNAYYHGPMGEEIQSGEFSHWYQQFETNVLGTVKMTRAVLPQMKAQKSGAIVMISTMGVKMVPLESEGGYAGSKAMLYNVTRKLATEVGPHNIRVNSLHPGWMWGEPVRNALAGAREQWGTEEEAYAKISSHHALRRIATDDECARAALFLASDYASAICGASLDANAGGFMP
jgi:NAD(P)-dependent dehydrogenase (short-subunit alcohol dehydrogenase family)